MNVVVMKEDTVDHWKSDTFVLYFMKKWQAFHRLPGARFPAAVWPKYAPHIKRFMTKHKLINQEYKDFVDWVFELAAENKRPFVNFLATVDERTWVLYQRLKQAANPHVVQSLTIAEVNRLTSGVLSNGFLFPKESEEYGQD